MSIAADNSASQIVQIQARLLRSVVSDFPIVRDGEFCETDTFLEAIPAATVDIISKVSTSVRSPFQSEYCSRRSEQELLNAIRSQSLIALRNSIVLGAVAIKYLQRDDPARGIVISMFARTLRYQWQLSKADKDLDDTIYYFRKTVEIEPIEEQNRALHFDDLGCALWERYTVHHLNVDFQEAKSAFENAAALPHSGKPMFLSNLGRLLKDKAIFIDDGKKSLLDESLAIHLQAISCVTPEFRASIHSLHRQLAVTYMEVFPVPNIDLSENIDSTVGDKVQASSHGWMFFYELACEIGTQFLTSGLQSDADKSIALFRSILKATPHNKLVISALVDILDNKAFSLKSYDLLNEAYYLSDGLLSSTGDADMDLLPRLQQTALLLMRRFDLVGIIEDVDKAIFLTTRALASPLMTDSFRWRFKRNLGIQLSYRFNVTEQPNDLRMALENLEVAVSATGLSKVEKAICLREYGRVLFTQSKVEKKEGRLDEVIKLYKEAIDLLDENDQSIVSCLNDLANATLIKFENDGRPNDADQAVDYYLEALACLERFPLIKAEKSLYFVGLGNAFFIKFEMWDQIADLNQAIYYYQEAVDHSLDLEANLPSRIGSLSRAVLRKFQITTESKYLLAAQNHIQLALDRSPPPSPQSVASLQNSMGISYLHAFDASNEDITFFDKAADCFQAALDTGCTQPFVRHPPIINLGRTLMGKYEYTKSDDDMIKAAAQLSQLSFLVQNGNNRELRGVLDTAGKFCTLVYDVKKFEQMARVGIFFYRRLAAEPAAVPERRLLAALQASRLSFEAMHDSRTATDILTSAFKILPEAILMGPNRADHLRAAKSLSSCPSFFLSFSLAAGDSPAESLKLFEQTRCIFWNRLFDLKTDITHLRETHEDLAVRFDALRNTLNRLQPQAAMSEFTAPNLLDQHRLAREYNECLCLIRQQEGFENFLTLEEPSRLQVYASQGPVVILNASRFRGDAIIITSTAVTSLPLVGFDLHECFTQAANIQVALKSGPDTASTPYKSSLKWLWKVVVEPVLDKLGFTHGGQSLPRIWWLMNGWTALLPIHAAGDHDHALKSGEPCTVIDRTISSYIPTLRSLDHVRKSAAAFSHHPNTALLVQMPTTPDDQELTNVPTEVALVEQILQERLQVTSLESPKRKDVLSLLATSSMAHFACHGTANLNDPSLSQLKLQDWKTAPLDVRALLRNSLKTLQFVYLSACETAAIKALELREECIHLSAAFQMAGVPYTVATLWKIEDKLSVEMANDFYVSLIEGQKEIDFGQSAKALHSAVLKARRRGVDVLLWGAFIHAGA
jgi:tetratricopeptide (TPR) repeat protein